MKEMFGLTTDATTYFCIIVSHFGSVKYKMVLGDRTGLAGYHTNYGG